jgi:hypothetical protein
MRLKSDYRGGSTPKSLEVVMTDKIFHGNPLTRAAGWGEVL